MPTTRECYTGVRRETPRRVIVVLLSSSVLLGVPRELVLELVCWLMGFAPPSGPQWGRVRTGSVGVVITFSRPVVPELVPESACAEETAGKLVCTHIVQRVSQVKRHAQQSPLGHASCL